MKNIFTKFIISLLAITFHIHSASAQNNKNIREYLNNVASTHHLSVSDVSNWIVSDYHKDDNEIEYYYLNQTHSGIKIFNAVSTFVIRQNKAVHFANRFYAKDGMEISSSKPLISYFDAVKAAASHLELHFDKVQASRKSEKREHQYVFQIEELSKKDIHAELIYIVKNQKMILAYNISISMKNTSDWWNIRIDASSGDFIDKNNWTLHCSFGHDKKEAKKILNSRNFQSSSSACLSPGPDVQSTPNYRVYPLPIEAPIYGNSALLTNPADLTSSPFGWHDTNGSVGDEYTITRGNNVYAYEDRANQDAPGYSPNGGFTLNFDFPINFSNHPSLSQDAIITNLFYVNNTMHDVLYHYGFTESAGNFQQNNYGKGGLANDFVLAEAQDGGGQDNANFSSPEDGQNGVMQMYLWAPVNSYTSKFTINSPLGIAGDYISEEAGFGPSLSSPLTSEIVLVNDGVGTTSDGCSQIQNASAINGKIALIDRGTCNFTDKVLFAQTAGAIAVIIANNVSGNPFTMSGSVNPNIPAFMISRDVGNLIKSAVSGGNSVNVTLGMYLYPPNVPVDGSLDNGVVVHEYGHGVSIRLSGGAGNSNCLLNDEQAGEGWSDWYALSLTCKAGDKDSNPRGIGNYAMSELPNGPGIRRYPYSTDKNINPLVYSSLASSSGVHQVGEVWCTVLWDMYWKLVNLEGFDPDFSTGTGGNNIALNLVTNGLKLQPCDPGFLDSRDAILAADNILYGGKYSCLIWEAFAGRGMGYSANQGSVYAIGDETAAYDLPTACIVPSSAPVAKIKVDNNTKCTNTFFFTDLSSSTQLSWLWNFGDQNTSILQNPTHTYTTPGIYQVILKVNNSKGTDYDTISVEYKPISAPSVQGNLNICAGDSTFVSIIPGSGNTTEWMQNGIAISTNDTLYTSVLNSNTSYSVHEIQSFVTAKVGPPNSNFASGGYHNTSLEGKEYFTTYKPLTIKSCWVKAGGAAVRTVNLYDENEALLTSKSINIPNDTSRIVLNFDIPAPGNYSLGVSAGSNLYRNNAGVQYPYTVNNLISITSSNATGAPMDYFYYLYDWLIEENHCVGDTTHFTVQTTDIPVAGFSYVQNGISISFTDLSTNNPTSWQWHFGDGDSSSLQNPTHTYTQNGTYIVSLKAVNSNCSSTTQQQIDILSVGIDNENTNFNVSVYPNPAEGNAYMVFNKAINEQIQYEISSYDGRLMHTSYIEKSSQKVELHLDDYKNGIYFLRLKNSTGIKIIKFIVLK